MIRVRTEQRDEEKLEEIGYKIGTRGNDCQAKLNEDLDKLCEQQRVLKEDYDKVQKMPEPTQAFEEILLRQINLEKKGVAVYE